MIFCGIKRCMIDGKSLKKVEIEIESFKLELQKIIAGIAELGKKEGGIVCSKCL